MGPVSNSFSVHVGRALSLKLNGSETTQGNSNWQPAYKLELPDSLVTRRPTAMIGPYKSAQPVLAVTLKNPSSLSPRAQAGTLAAPVSPGSSSSYVIPSTSSAATEERVEAALALAKSALRAAQLAKACAEAEMNAWVVLSNGEGTRRLVTLQTLPHHDRASGGLDYMHERGTSSSSFTITQAEMLERLQPETTTSQASGTGHVDVVVRSRRKAERMRKRERALEKVDRAVLNGSHSGSTSRRRSSTSAPMASERGDPIRSYMREVGRGRLLTGKEEVELARGIQDLLKLERVRDYLEQQMGREPTVSEWSQAVGMDEHGFEMRIKEGRACKDKMVLSNLRLVVSIAKNYQGRGLAFQDLMQEGCMGLIRGAEKFDHRRGFKFSTYAHWWIRQAVNRAIADQSRTVRLPVHMCEVISRITKARHMLRTEHGRTPREEEVAELVGMSVPKLRMVLRSAKLPRSMEQPITKDSDRQLSEFVADEVAQSPEEGITKRLMKQDLENVLHTLSPRERDVVRLRYGLDDGRVKTLEEIGHVFRVTRERIRQIESKAMRKLRQPARNTVLSEYMEIVGN